MSFHDPKETYFTFQMEFCQWDHLLLDVHQHFLIDPSENIPGAENQRGAENT